MKRAITFLVSGAVAVGSLVAVVANSAYAATACRATYAVTNSWTDGFQASLTIDNLGDPLNGWSVAFTFPTTGQRVTQGWNATWSQTGAAVTATNASWNASLATNATSVAGLHRLLERHQPGARPAFTVNGAACTGSAPPTTATTTTRPPTTTTTTRPPTTTTTTAAHHDHDHDHTTAADDPAHHGLEPAGQPGHPAGRGLGPPGEHLPGNLYGFRNYGWDQVMANGGFINYCVRWDSSAPVSRGPARPDPRTRCRASSTSGWTSWPGHNNWPYANVPVRVVGWAVRDRSHAAVDGQLGRHLRQQHPRERPAVLRAVRTVLPPGRQLLRLPGRRRPPLRHVAVADRRLRRRRRRRLGPAHGQRVLRRRLNTDNIHILLHEIGHTFGLDDFYDWTPTGQCCFIMKAG